MINIEKIIQAIEIVKSITNSQDIYLFGSYANGTANEQSDVDIAIIKDDVSKEYQESTEIRKAILSQGYFPLDLVFINKQNYEQRKKSFGTLQYEISENGVKF